MTDTVKVRIGGEEIAVPLIMNFATLKRTAAARDAFAEASDQMGQVAAGLALIAQILLKTKPELSAPALEEKLRVRHYDPATDDAETGEDERPGLIEAIVEIYKASGLIPRKPPVMPAAETEDPPSASTETGITLLLSSLVPE